MAWFVVRTTDRGGIGRQRRIVSGRLPTEAAANAALTALGGGSALSVVEVPRARLRGLGEGSFLRGDRASNYALAAGPDATVAVGELLILRQAWQRFVAHLPAESWRNDLAPSGLDAPTRGLTRGVYHALALGQHAANGTGPWAAATEQQRRDAVQHVADWAGGSREGEARGPGVWATAIGGLLGTGSLRVWTRLRLTSATAITCGLFVPVRNGVPTAANTPVAETAWTDTIGTVGWR